MTNDVIIPALPGYYHIRFTPPTVGKVTPQSIKERAKILPVLAWKITADSRLPVTPHDSDPVENEIRVLLLPSGVILDVAGVQHRGFDAWSTAVAEAWRSKQPPARGPAFSLGPIANPDPAPPAEKSAWVA